MTVSPSKASEVLEVLGVEDNETNNEQMCVMLEAFAVFLERQEDYEDLWAESGSANNLLQAQSKVARMGVAKARLETKTDSGLDLINYAAFYVRNVRQGR